MNVSVSTHRVTSANIEYTKHMDGSGDVFNVMQITGTDEEGNDVVLKLFSEKKLKLEQPQKIPVKGAV